MALKKTIKKKSVKEAVVHSDFFYPEVVLTDGTVVPAIQGRYRQIDWSEYFVSSSVFTEDYAQDDDDDEEDIGDEEERATPTPAVVAVPGNDRVPRLPVLWQAEMNYLLATGQSRLTTNQPTWDNIRNGFFLAGASSVALEWIADPAKPTTDVVASVITPRLDGMTRHMVPRSKTLPGSQMNVPTKQDPRSMVAINANLRRTLYPEALNDVEEWAQRILREAHAVAMRLYPTRKEAVLLCHSFNLPKALVELRPAEFLTIEVSGETHAAYVSKDRRIIITSAMCVPAYTMNVWEAVRSALGTEPVTDAEFAEAWVLAMTEGLAGQKDVSITAIQELRRQLIAAETAFGKIDKQLSLLKRATATMVNQQVEATRKLSAVSNVTLTHHGIRVTTDDIFAMYKGGEYFMGQYLIEMEFSGEIWVTNLKATKTGLARPHPHCFSHGGACFGGYQQLLSSCILDYDFAGSIRVVIDFLGNLTEDDYNASSAIADKLFTKGQDGEYYKGARSKIGKFNTITGNDEENED